jgi:hypothetical protein
MLKKFNVQYGNNTSFAVKKVIIDDENEIFKATWTIWMGFMQKMMKLVNQNRWKYYYVSYIVVGIKYSVEKINKVRTNLTKFRVDKKVSKWKSLWEAAKGLLWEKKSASWKEWKL